MISKYSENVYYSSPVVETDRPALGYIRGNDYSVMVDSGNSPAHARQFLKELESLGLPYPSFVILTHSHWDHCYGLSEIKAPAIACRSTYLKLLAEKDLTYTRESFYSARDNGTLEPFIWEAMEQEYSDFSEIRIVLPAIIFEQELTLDLGNQKVLCRKCINPHSDDSVYVLAQDEGILFTGDACYMELTGNSWTDHPDKVRQLRKELALLPFDLAITAHSDSPYTKSELLSWLAQRID